MVKPVSKQKIIRSMLIGICLFIWGIWIPSQIGDVVTLFCYTRDEMGNKALVKDNGVVYVEDTFIMEIPADEMDKSGESTITVIMEDEMGNRKKKTIRLCQKRNLK